MQSKVKILLIYTGGTIGMMKNFETGALKAFNFSKLLNKIPELKQLDCEIETISFEKPIDSSNMNSIHWIKIAKMIDENYASFDGFVVLHGSDTMSYSASALSFMLENLNKPVIFTTAYKDFALDAFEVSAVDYVLKPVTLERLQLAIEKIKQVLPVVEEKKYVQLNSDKGKSIIYFDKITYIATSEIDSRDKILWFEDGSKLKLKNISFDKLQVSLPFGQFVRVNKKELLSMRCIHSFSSYEIKTSILLQTGKNLTLNLSEIYKEEFIKKVTLA